VWLDASNETMREGAGVDPPGEPIGRRCRRHSCGARPTKRGIIVSDGRDDDHRKASHEAARRIDEHMSAVADRGDRAFADEIERRRVASTVQPGAEAAAVDRAEPAASVPDRHRGSDGAPAVPRSDTSREPSGPSFRVRPLTWVLVVVGFAFVALGVYYFVTPAHALLSFVPGHQARSNLHHMKHGMAALALALAAWVGAWFTTRP
jgi:hypothetical protein